MRVALTGLVVGLTVLFVSACDDDTQVSPANLPDAGPSVEAGPPPARVEDLLEPLHASSGVPGLAALVLRDGSVIAEGAVGVRKTDDPTPVSADDVWYLGTATEAITATLAALVVEEGKLDWSSTLGAILADLPMHAAYKDVSLADLLTHRAGAPATLSDAVALALGQGDGSAQAHRDAAVRALLAAGPGTPPHGEVLRSDAGYLIAAALLERASGSSWELMLRARVLDPLGMAGCRYDALPNAGAGAPAEPWGHTRNGSGALQAVAPGTAPEPPPAFGPAVRLRCPLRDWAKLCVMHLQGERGEKTPLLGAASFATLHSPVRTTVAMGWNAVFQTWAGRGRALTHASSNPLHSAVVWLAPDKKLTFLVVANQADDVSLVTVDRVVGELVGRFAQD